MLRILFGVVWRLVLLLLLLTSLLIGFVLGSESGLRGALHVVDRVLPGAIRYEAIDGAFFNALTIQGLEVRFGAFQLDLGRFEWAWQPTALFSRHLLIERLHATDINLVLPPAEPTADSDEPLQLPELALPLDISLLDMQVEKFTLRQPDQTPVFVLNQLSAALHTEQDKLLLDRLALELPQLQASADGQLIPQHDYPLTLTLDWQYNHPQFGDFSGQGTLTGELSRQIKLNHALDGALTAQLNATVEQPLLAPSWTLSLTANSQDLGLFVPDLAATPMALELHSKGQLTDFSATGELQSTIPQFGPLQANFELSGTPQNLHLQTLHLQATEQPLKFDLAAEVDLASQAVKANGSWQALSWPPGSDTPQIASPSGSLNVTGTLDDFRADLQTALSGEQFGALELTLKAIGSQQELRQLQLTLNEPDGELEFNLNGSAQLADLSFDTTADWQQLRWPLTAAAQIISPSGSLTAQGKPSDYQAELNAVLDGPQLTPLDASANVKGDQQTLRLSKLQLQARDSPMQLNAQAELALQSLDFKASGEWQELSWPMTGPAEYQSERGQFKADGNLQDYDFTLESTVGGRSVPSGTWQLQGHGNANALNDLQIAGDTLAGTLQGAVQASWQPQVSWQATLDGTGINPGEQWPDLPGKLDFKLSSQGQIESGTLRAELQLSGLQGQLSNQTVRGGANVSLVGSELNIRQLELQAGQATLSASGALAEQWNVDWQLAVPELRGLLPSASGSLSGQGTLGGTAQQPQATAKLNGRALSLGELKLARLDGQIQLDLTGSSSLQLTAQQLSAAGQEWQRITLDGSGTQQQHNLSLVADGTLGDYRLELAGGVQDQTWQGQLRELKLQQTPAGNWQLAQAVALNANASQANLNKLCLSSKPSQLCLQADWNASTGGRVNLDLDQLTLNRFESFLPPDLSLDSTLSGNLRGELGPAGQLDGSLDIRLSEGQIEILVNGRPVKLAINGGVIKGRSDGNAAESSIELDLGRIGQLDSTVKISDLQQQAKIQGDLQATINDFSIVSELVPDVQDLSGRLAADIKFSGNLQSPALNGNVTLTDGGVSIPQTGTRIEAIQLQTTSTNQGELRFTGTARSGTGTLTLDGSVKPFEQQAEVTIKGEDFEALDTFSQMVVSPDMLITADEGQIRISGTVTVPSAQLSPPASGRNRVSPSSDVIIVKEQTEPAANGPELYARLRIVLGEEVWVNTDVFTAQLKGDLQIEQTPQLAPRGSGSVEVVSGTYTIYGQDLTIERGRILFSGGPLTNPGLDLRVSRTFESDDIEVGAQIIGSVKQPELKLFSSPAMLESNIVSYLVFGRAPSGSGDENALLYQAAALLGASHGNKVTDTLSEGLGVDLSLDTGSALEETELVIGKYLSPELYVSYGVGLFEAVNTFNLRYQLTKWLTLQAASATSGDNSADLLYTIER